MCCIPASYHCSLSLSFWVLVASLSPTFIHSFFRFRAKKIMAAMRERSINLAPASNAMGHSKPRVPEFRTWPASHVQPCLVDCPPPCLVLPCRASSCLALVLPYLGLPAAPESIVSGTNRPERTCISNSPRTHLLLSSSIQIGRAHV